MRQIENLIFIILIMGLFICVQFWRQISRIQLPESSPVLFSIDLKLQSSLDSNLLFSTGLEFQSDLDSNRISDGLRQEFVDKEITFSRNASVSTEEQGSLWRIIDDNRAYTLSKKGDKLNVYNSRPIPENLRKEFDNNKNKNKTSLSQDATLATIERGNLWRVTDRDMKRRYDIKKEEKRLNVYRATDTDVLPPFLSVHQLYSIDLLTGRDVFKLPFRQKEEARSPAPPEVEPILSTIVWSPTKPLAVINGEVLAVGKLDSKSKFRVKSITREYVQIHRIGDNQTIRLTLPSHQPGNKVGISDKS